MITIFLFNETGQNRLTVELSQAIKAQTVKPKVFIWNNSPTRISGDAADWVVNSSKPIGHKALSLMAVQADTKFVCHFDNDIYPKDRWILDDAISLHSQICEFEQMLGAYGVNLKNREIIQTPNEDVEVDVIYEKFYIVNRIAITNIEGIILETDFSLSLKLATSHVVGGCFDKRFWQRRKFNSLDNKQIERLKNV